MPKPESPYVDEHIIVHDITDDLPRHKTKQFGRVPSRPVSRVILHHTAGGVAPGLVGPMSTGRFFVAPKRYRYTVGGEGADKTAYEKAKEEGRDARKRNVGGRGWPGFAYHVFIPYNPKVDSDGRMVVYQTQDFDVRGTHTAGQNAHGIGVVCQGLFVSRYHPGKPRRQPTKHPSQSQQLAVQRVWRWLKGLYALPNSALHTHSMYAKPACPGEWLDGWARRVRAS